MMLEIAQPLGVIALHLLEAISRLTRIYDLNLSSTSGVFKACLGNLRKVNRAASRRYRVADEQHPYARRIGRRFRTEESKGIGQVRTIRIHFAYDVPVGAVCTIGCCVPAKMIDG